MKRIFTKKFPDKLPALESFISNSLLSIEIVDTPEIPVEEESLMRDMMNRPILQRPTISDQPCGFIGTVPRIIPGRFSF